MRVKVSDFNVGDVIMIAMTLFLLWGHWAWLALATAFIVLLHIVTARWR